MKNTLRRAFTALVGTIGSSILIFVLLRVLPGDLATTRLGVDATPQALAALRSEYGFDQSAVRQYLNWLVDLMRGDLGTSLVTGDDVLSDVTSRLDVTVPLITISTMLAVIFALFVGRRAAVRRGRVSTTLFTALSQLGLAVPTFVIGVGLISVFAVQLNLLPAGGFPVSGWRQFDRAVQSMLLPILTLTFAQVAMLVRFSQARALDFLASDAFRTARAGGRTKDRAMTTAARLILSPILSVAALQISTLLVGAVVVESVFALPGLGTMFVRDIANRDFIKVQSVSFVFVVATFIVRLTIEFVNDRLDPRRLP